MAADWSHLPRELLDLISKHLSSDTDRLRFRSVCTHWRSSILPISSRFPILPNVGISDTTWAFFLSKRTIFRLSLPNPNPHLPWLVKVERDNPQRTRLMNPLTGSQSLPLPPTFPRSLNLLNFRVSEIGYEYALQNINYRPNANSIEESVSLYAEKVAFRSTGDEGFVLMTIHVSGRLAVLKNGDRRWKLIEEMSNPFDDVVVFKGEFHAVDGTGRVVVVELDTMRLRAVAVAGPVFGGDKKVLVESNGELLMVDKHLSGGMEDADVDEIGEGYEFYEDMDCLLSERTVKFEVYRLDEEGQRWVEVRDLGDRMLFWGENCAFSASAEDFPGCRGNCVFFAEQGREDDGVIKSQGVGVFDLESGSIGAVGSNSGYSRLFWPPPRWIYSDPLDLEDRLDNLNV